MAQKVGCHCGGLPDCRLCHGSRFYAYQPGPRGWMPFRCPTCAGRGVLGADAQKCPTCQGNGQVDPTDPPSKGMWDVIWKSLFGAT